VTTRTTNVADKRTSIRFTVAGVPAPQGSKTVARSSSGRSFVREDNPETEPWRNAVAAAAVEAMGGREPLGNPLYVEVTFRFARTQDHYRSGRHAGELKDRAPTYKPKRPDLDKLVRALGDAITGIVCVDDAQIVELYAVKCFGSPGMDVYVTEIEP
jgi:Holliday junction resolvase RusA-like endonuclease